MQGRYLYNTSARRCLNIDIYTKACVYRLFFYLKTATLIQGCLGQLNEYSKVLNIQMVYAADYTRSCALFFCACG
jgi:hypothetical protein